MAQLRVERRTHQESFNVWLKDVGARCPMFPLTREQAKPVRENKQLFAAQKARPVCAKSEASLHDARFFFLASGTFVCAKSEAGL